MVEKLTALVEKSMKGDKAAFEELIARKQRDILYITSRFCSPQDLEDYAQEALLLMFKNFNQLRDPSCFNDWMYNIIRNTCMYCNRRKLRRSRIAEITSFDPDSEGLLNTLEEDREEFMPAEYLESKEKREEVMSALNELPETYRECLLLFFYEEMSYKEIARALQINTKSVSNYLFRAKQELKKHLDLAVKRNEIFSIPAMSAVPVLTQILKEEVSIKIPQELCDKVLHETVGRLGETSIVPSAAALSGTGASKTALLSGTAISKTILGVISVLTITGVTALTINHVKQETPGASLNVSGLESGTTQTLRKASDSAKTLMKPIDTLADLIGEDYLKKLVRYEKEGVSKAEWAQFVKDIGAGELTRAGTTKGSVYMMSVLEKQDKQLRMVTRDSSGNQKLQVKYEFGVTQKQPNIAHFIIMFE